MRLSTAVTLSLVALLATAALGAVIAIPVAAGGNHGPGPNSGSGTDHSSILLTESATLSPTESVTAAASDSHNDGETRYAHTNNQTEFSYGTPAETAQLTRINVTSDGDAHWTLEFRFVLEDDDTVETFTHYAEAVTAGERDDTVDIPIQQIRQQAADASAETGREMSVTDAGWDGYDFAPYDDDIDTQNEPDGAYEDESIGVISYSFTWTNFARTDDDRLYFGDALQTDTNGNPWSTLRSDQRLVIESPENYGLETPTQLTWDGHHEFSEDEFDIVFLRGAQSSGLLSNISVPVLVALLGTVGVLAVAGSIAYRYFQDKTVPLLTQGPKGNGNTNSEQATTGPDVEGDAEVDERSLESGDNAFADDGERLEFSEQVTDDIDPELLSDEEQIHRMLARNGGRMKQAAIVSETGWSNAKVSQLLSKMDEDGEIEKLRIGRENLITLPEVDPTEIN